MPYYCFMEYSDYSFNVLRFVSYCRIRRAFRIRYHASKLISEEEADEIREYDGN